MERNYANVSIEALKIIDNGEIKIVVKLSW
jgi:hypothetical protein